MGNVWVAVAPSGLTGCSLCVVGADGEHAVVDFVAIIGDDESVFVMQFL